MDWMLAATILTAMTPFYSALVAAVIASSAGVP